MKDGMGHEAELQMGLRNGVGHLFGMSSPSPAALDSFEANGINM